MAQLYDEAGNPVEAFTEEEMTTKVEEETKKAITGLEETNKKKIDEAEEKVKILMKEKEDLEKKIQDDPKEKNFKNLRDKADIKDEQISDLTKKIDELKAGLDKQISEITGTNKQAEIKAEILAAVGGDKEIAKKVEIAYGKLVGVPTTPEELQTRIADAIKLATDDKGRPLLNSSIFNSAGGGKSTSAAGKISEDVAEMAKKNMGLSDKELKKANLI